jgi:hypothetical protein
VKKRTFIMGLGSGKEVRGAADENMGRIVLQ